MRRCESATWTPTRRSAAFYPKVSHLAPLPFPLPVSVASFHSAFGSRLCLDWMTDRSLSRAFSSRSILEICSYLLLLRWCSGANTLQACGSRAGLATFFYLFQIFLHSFVLLFIRIYLSRPLDLEYKDFFQHRVFMMF
jgi:hypothetical protein